MPCFLSLECSTAQGSLALLDLDNKNLSCLGSKTWSHQFKSLGNAHSDKLPLEIDKILKESQKTLSDLDFLAVGVGPGRFTGIRIAVNVIRTLAFCLKLPCYPVNSLRICAEPFLSQSQPVFVAFNAFKNKIYWGKFYSKKLNQNSLTLLSFENWLSEMEQLAQDLKTNSFCLTDLEDFYPIPVSLKNKFLFKKSHPEALNLAQIIFEQKQNLEKISWGHLQASYFKSPV